ncbi:hypothetical protein KUTeg_005064 [Tegillarca granosa]|uniref:Uncharacterized protein n=1 Tax=Tegillarca granosa TaxID=220873 RepID=A0ABQ9FN72_TEGGR|nr:hypothetical protein KUTeg_005064 [Tegillarca granosa]
MGKSYTEKLVIKDDEDDYLECAERTDQKESFGTGSTDYQNACQGSLDRDSEGECIETVNKKDPAECPETENTNVQKDCIETESRDEQHGCHGTFDAAHPKAEQDIHVVNNGKSTSNLDYEVVERKQVLFEDEESSSEGDGIQTYSSSSEYDESDSDSKGFKGLPDRRTAMRNRGGCQQQKKHKQLAKKQYSGYGMQLSGKSKSMQSKNTYVKGASGCIIGDNINITHNQMKEDVDIRVRSLEGKVR